MSGGSELGLLAAGYDTSSEIHDNVQDPLSLLFETPIRALDYGKCPGKITWSEITRNDI